MQHFNLIIGVVLWLVSPCL